MRIAICGRGGCGKGEAARWFRDNLGMRYTHSTSEYAGVFVWPALEAAGVHYESQLDCWLDRRNHRQFWYEEIARYNADDPARMYREMAETHDIIDGLRKLEDLRACRDAKIVDLVLWIDRPGCVDPTMQYRAEDCDVVIPNRGTLEDFHAALREFAAAYICKAAAA